MILTEMADMGVSDFDGPSGADVYGQIIASGLLEKIEQKMIQIGLGERHIRAIQQKKESFYNNGVFNPKRAAEDLGNFLYFLSSTSIVKKAIPELDQVLLMLRSI
jgi:hypothetical protein